MIPNTKADLIDNLMEGQGVEGNSERLKLPNIQI